VKRTFAKKNRTGKRPGTAGFGFWAGRGVGYTTRFSAKACSLFDEGFYPRGPINNNTKRASETKNG